MKKIIICLITILLIAFPASAEGVSLNRWILNVTVNDDGLVDELIQIEVANGGSLPLDGISFTVPASSLEVIYDFDHTFSSKGQTVEQQTVNNGIKLNVRFNTSVKTGETWNGRIAFKAKDIARKTAQGYTIELPVDMPQAIISGKNTDIGISQDAEIRGQVFLPKGFEVTSVTPKPFRILFQNSHMVPTWTSQDLHAKDVINLTGSFSDLLNKIADVDQRSKILSKRLVEAKANGTDVADAEEHLKNAEDFNTNNANSALSSFWKKDEKSALESIGNAENEISLAEKSFSASGKTEVTTEKTAQETGNNTTPGFGGTALILMIGISFMLLRRRSKS